MILSRVARPPHYIIVDHIQLLLWVGNEEVSKTAYSYTVSTCMEDRSWVQQRWSNSILIHTLHVHKRWIMSSTIMKQSYNHNTTAFHIYKHQKCTMAAISTLCKSTWKALYRFTQRGIRHRTESNAPIETIFSQTEHRAHRNMCHWRHWPLLRGSHRSSCQHHYRTGNNWKRWFKALQSAPLHSKCS